MDALTRLTIQQDCTDVVTRYALAVNRWDLDDFTALFHPDATWQRPDNPPLVGHGAIRAFMESQPHSPTERVLRHVNGGVLVEVLDADTATVWSQTTVYEGPPASLPVVVAGPDLVVEYLDRMVRSSGGWLIARRDTTVVFRAPR